MAEKFLLNKKVLFIGYEYYDYHIHICKALRQAGADLDYRPIMNRHIWYLLSRQISFKCFVAYNDRYASKVLESVRGKKYDYVLVTLGFQLPGWLYSELRKLNPDAVFINYTWDSVRETEHRNTILDIVLYFDRAYSFDPSDCERYGMQRYLPLFYIDEYADLADEQKDCSNDILFIGSLCTEIRYRAVKQIKKLCSLNNLKFFYYLYVSYRFYFRRLINGKITPNIHFKSIKHSDILKYYSDSKVIIDLTGQTQSGLNLRTFEVLGAGKKLITSNANIKRELFYDPENISVIDSENPVIDVDFIRKETSKKIDMSNYSIHAWLKNLFAA